MFNTANVGCELRHLAGAARVRSPTAGSVEFKADYRNTRGGRVCDCPTARPLGRCEEQTGCRSDDNTGEARRELHPQSQGTSDRSTARRGLRGNQANEPPGCHWLQ
jgi:hypothetical protein